MAWADLWPHFLDDKTPEDKGLRQTCHLFFPKIQDMKARHIALGWSDQYPVGE